MRAALSILILATLSPTGSSWAEGARVDITPSAGAFNPTQDNLDESVPGLGTVTARFGSASMLGGRVSIWLNRHFAIEGTGYYAGGSSLEGQAFGIPGAVDASFFYGTGRFVVGVGNRSRLLLSAGLGAQSSSYDTPAIADGTITVGVIGAGMLLPVGDSVSLRFDVDNYVYNMYWELDDVRSTELLQRDVVFAAGLTFHTGS